MNINSMESQNDEVFTQEVNQAEEKQLNQTRLTKKRNEKLVFSSGKSPKKQKKQVAPIQPVTVISSSDEEEMSNYQMLQDHLIFDLFETVKQNSAQDLFDWDIFSTFLNALYEDRAYPKNYYPVTVLIILHFLMVHGPKWKDLDLETKQIIVAGLLDINMGTLPQQMNSPIMVKTHLTMKKFPAFSQELKPTDNLLVAWTCIQQTIKSLGIMPYEYLPVSSMLDIWENMVDTSRTFVSRQHLRILHNYFKNFDPTCLVHNESQCVIDNGDSFLDTATTSTSYTSAPIQTQLVAVRGSTEVRRGDDVDERDLDDEFTCLTSRFTTGKTSLDISLQKDTQSKILKAEVKMEDYVYELKIYK